MQQRQVSPTDGNMQNIPRDDHIDTLYNTDIFPDRESTTYLAQLEAYLVILLHGRDYRMIRYAGLPV